MPWFGPHTSLSAGKGSISADDFAAFQTLTDQPRKLPGSSKAMRRGLRFLSLVLIIGLPVAPMSTGACQPTEVTTSPCGGAGLHLGPGNPCMPGSDSCISYKS